MPKTGHFCRNYDLLVTAEVLCMAWVNVVRTMWLVAFPWKIMETNYVMILMSVNPFQKLNQVLEFLGHSNYVEQWVCAATICQKFSLKDLKRRLLDSR